MKAFQLPSLKDLLKESAANVLYFIGQAILFLLLTPKLYNAFGEELYGIWTILLSVLVLSGYLNIGSIAAIVKFISKYSTSPKNKNELAASLLSGYAIIIFFSCLMSGILFFSASKIAELINTDISSETLTYAFLIISVGIIPHYVSQASRAVLWGLMKSRLALTIFFIHDIFLWGGALFLANKEIQVVSLSYWILIVNTSRLIITTGLVFLYLKEFKIKIKWDNKIAKSILSFSVLDWIGIVGVSMFSIVPKIEVGWVLSASSAGIYGMAAGIGVRISALADYLSQALLPYISGHLQEKEYKKVQQVYSKAFEMISIALAIGVISLVLVMNVFLTYWISKDFSDKYSQLFSMLALAYGFYAIFSPSIRALEGLGLIKWRSAIQLLSGISVVFLIWQLGKHYDLMGVMWATWMLGVNMITHLIVLHKINSLNPKEIFKMIFVSGLIIINALIVFFFEYKIVFYVFSMISVLLLLANSARLIMNFKVRSNLKSISLTEIS